MKFNKKFGLGLFLEYIGILTAWQFMSDYRLYSILMFWGSIFLALLGLFLLVRGVEKRPISN